ncbi:PR5-like receptor kinase [Abrus precatorius]|uniref:PR5-like receptor kinase n=1 Tax=Abrus precatorius TaxID=3816 RepID=A0A8B8LPN0_ABRPR|nr:PR5-like receptor kinase [Abrus precatorius]
MFRVIPLLYVLSLTATLLHPSSTNVNFNTASALKGRKHLNEDLETVKVDDKGSNGHHESFRNGNAQDNLKVDVYSSCNGREDCNNSSSRSSLGSDSANVVRVKRMRIVYTVNSSSSASATVCSSGSRYRSCLRSSASPRSSPSSSPSHSAHRLSPSSSSPLHSIPPSSPLLPPSPSPTPSPTPTFLPPSPPPSPASGNHHHVGSWKIAIGIASGIMSAILMCIVICCYRYKSLSMQVKLWFTTKSDLHIEAFLKEHRALAQKRYKFSEVKKMTNYFKDKLGQGGFGAVYKGKLPTGYPVAVKLLKSSKGNGEDFINEVASITRTSHVNVVTLLGFCLEGQKKALIYEFMANGSLDKYIYNKGPETIASLSWENLYQIAIGIAHGLEYLHRGCKTRILHFDIKPHNILLDENFCPKISDFGLAKLCPRKESIISMSDARGTMGYVAPEMCNRHFGGVSHKSDVYSYGMMLLEMVGGRKNINAEASQTSEIFFPHLVYKRLELDNDIRPDEVMTIEENEIAKRMTIVGLWCIQTFPNDRPTMSRVVDMLEGSMNSLEIPPKPLLSSPTRTGTESSSSN